ncbi:hypothetical protein E4T42_02220 [Aureobasidium subglaciale]|nr:hypothetical protein E4T42_02220 [Aureobasidium subglaciale]
MALVYTWGVGLPCTLHYSLIVEIANDTGITVEDLVQGNGLMFSFLGLGCLFWQPIATTYGGRAYTTTSASWFAHRIIIGLVLAPIESLPEISIADLFFAHERGT